MISWEQLAAYIRNGLDAEQRKMAVSIVVEMPEGYRLVDVEDLPEYGTCPALDHEHPFLRIGLS